MDVRLTPRVNPSAPALLLSPHFDDAIFSCWGLLSNGEPLYSAIVFSGTPAPDWADAHWTGKDESDFILDSILATQFAYSLAGRKPGFLPFSPARYRQEDPSFDALAQEICRVAPEVSAIYAPAGLADHPDHLLLRGLAVRLYALGVPIFLYAEMPVACRRGWPALIVPRKGEENTAEIVLEWKRRLAQVKPIDLHSPIITSLGFQGSVAKQRMAKTCAELASGEGAVSAERVVNLLLDPGISRYEVCWPLGQEDD